MSDLVRTVNSRGDIIWKNSKGHWHRANGLPAVERKNGTKEWWEDNKRHRLNGPAIEWKGGTHEFWTYGIFIGYGQAGYEQLLRSLNYDQKQDPDLIAYEGWARALNNRDVYDD